MLALWTASFAWLSCGGAGVRLQAEDRPNVVLLMADDLAATLGCYGYPAVKTPNLDKLAASGLLFDRAYCQFPHCNPSRASIFSGLRPQETGVTDNADNLYQNRPGVMTLPHWFREQGYATARCGKIFHLGVPSGLESMDDPAAWDFGLPFRDERPYPKARESRVQVNTGGKAGFSWKEINERTETLMDSEIASTAVNWLERRDPSKPFFLAVGFHRPHLPLVAPAEFFDLYPLESIQLPQEPADDEADIPLPARNGSVPGYGNSANAEQRRAAIRGYLACVSYVDAQAGLVLDTIDRLGLRDNTIVIFTSDHGWHLGEHKLWHKRSLFEECARVPLIVSVPGVTKSNSRTDSLTELLDLYPTLCDLAGLPTPPSQLQGVSLRPVLSDPSAKLKDAAFTEARRGPSIQYWGRSVRTPRWRYTEWNHGHDGIELYDHQTDPHEYTNLAADPAYKETVAELKTRLQRNYGTE